MLKLLLCSAMIIPCFVVPLSGAAKSQMTSVNKTSFEDAFIEPEFEQLERCKSAELDVFFHENYITMHSAEYLAEGIEIAKSCGNANFTITPIIPTASHVDKRDILDLQTKELSLILRAHGVEPIVTKADIQSEYNTLSANGRTAVLRIAFNEGRQA